MAVANVLGAALQLGGLLGGSKDPERLARNQQWYTAALAGDAEALKALQYMSGRFGGYDGGRYCEGGCAGWATKAAKDDAFAKYNAVLQARKLGTAIDQVQAQSGLVPAPSGAEAVLAQLQAEPAKAFMLALGFGVLVYIVLKGAKG